MFASNQARHRMEDLQKERMVVLHPSQEHKYSLIWLHGLGDSCHGFSDIFMDQRFNVVPPNCKVILPTAPERAVTCNGGMVMNSWYDIISMNRPTAFEAHLKNYSQSEIQDSVQRVSALIDQEASLLNNRAERVFLGGFSQGCAVTLSTFSLHKG